MNTWMSHEAALSGQIGLQATRNELVSNRLNFFSRWFVNAPFYLLVVFSCPLQKRADSSLVAEVCD